MPPNTPAPFETHLHAIPHGPRQRYFGPEVLDWDAVVVDTQFPGTINGNKFNIENFIVGTVFAEVAAGPTGVTVALGAYDLDDTTLLRVDALFAVAAGATGVIDFGTGSSGLLRGRVFRVHDLRVGTALALSNATVTLRLRVRSA